VDEELFSKQLHIENKIFYIDLKSNHNGKYLKISEKSGGRRHNILVPESGVEDLMSAITEATKLI
jgi:PurA ssDNA and RNA-binding protein